MLVEHFFWQKKTTMMLNEFIKKAITKVVNKKDSKYSPIIYCCILSAGQEDLLGEDMPGIESCYDMIKIARHIKEQLKSITNRNFESYSVLDYAEFYGIICKGNSIIFLRNYTNYVGQVE